MARPRSDIEFEKVTLRLGRGDVARMHSLFPKLGGHVAIRTLVRNFIRRVEASAAPVAIDLNPNEMKGLLDDDRDAADSAGARPSGS